MKVRVLFFGIAHDLTGFSQEDVEISEGERLEDLRRRYEGRFPRLRAMGGAVLTALNQEVAESAAVLHEGDEVAFLPPVSGGSDDERGNGNQRAAADFFQIVRRAIPTAVLAGELKAPPDGAVVVFEGIVRDNLRGRKTRYLEYEAYEPMAIRKMEEIGQEARQEFAIDHVGMVHRLGRLEIGETSVAIIVTAAHRRAAFEACHYAIDRLKQIVPIWKKEFFEDGEIWAEGENQKESKVES
ncbi:MAG TPA: molybdenum cofactor biosynthesis protein MoaE [Terriglobia bacterium]|nr:molybdenum cofactor biosynthesis protein MoaE [Terriglobia bacterium]